MKRIASIALISGVALTSPAAPTSLTLHLSWSTDSKTETYTNNDTKISFPKSVATFRRKEANPAKPDGSASFLYWGEKGFIRIELTHRALAGFPKPGDCTKPFVDAFRSTMREANGRSDLNQSFRLVYSGHGKQGKGEGTTYHFVASRELNGTSVYDEFGAVQVGDFLYYYRATFPEKAGLSDLAAFLHAIGVKKL